jgi:predicted PurR-regulated permease PerM
MTMTDTLAVIALLISMASLIVALASILIAVKNKQAGAVEPRIRAIDQMHEALSDLRQNQILTPKAIASITKAKNLADLVFSKKIRGDLDKVLGSAHEIAASVGHPGGGAYDFGRDMDVTQAVETALKTLIDQMSQEAALGG